MLIGRLEHACWEFDDNASLPVVNQEEKLEFRKDGLWYVIDEVEPYTGVAEAFHEWEVEK